MENKPKISSGAIQLYNLFIHGEIDRRAFMEGLQKFATGSMTAVALAQALMPNYAAGQQVSRTDERIKATYEAVPSPQGNGTIKGYFVRPVSADTRAEKPVKLPGIIARAWLIHTTTTRTITRIMATGTIAPSPSARC